MAFTNRKKQSNYAIVVRNSVQKIYFMPKRKNWCMYNVPVYIKD